MIIQRQSRCAYVATMLPIASLHFVQNTGQLLADRRYHHHIRRCALSATTTFSVRQFLSSREALLVHFNTPMTRHLKGFPHDLRDARQLVGTPIAFSTIQVNDKGPGQVQNPADANAVGSVGLIVDIQDAGSVLSVAPTDIGSNSRITGYAHGLGKPPSAQTCADSIDLRSRTDNNEWVVQDYTALGIFVFKPSYVYVTNNGDLPTSLAIVLSDFANDRFISVGNGSFVEYDKVTKTWTPISYAAIVPP
jgi:hypothetical protein